MGLFDSIMEKLGLGTASATPASPSSVPQASPAPQAASGPPPIAPVGPKGDQGDRCGGKAGRAGGHTQREAELEDLDRGPDETSGPRPV